MEASSTRSNSWAGTDVDSEGCCSAPVLNNLAGELIANSTYKRFITPVASAQENSPPISSLEKPQQHCDALNARCASNRG